MKIIKIRWVVDQTIFDLNFATFLHIFYIEKYQEYAYFDKFLVFVQKNGKCKFWVNWMQKGKLGRDLRGRHERRD